jgi:hypothetical protein
MFLFDILHFSWFLNLDYKISRYDKHSYISSFPPLYNSNLSSYSTLTMPDFFTAHSHQATPFTIPLVNLRPPLLSPAAASTDLISISNCSHLSNNNTPMADLMIQPLSLPMLNMMTSLYVYNQLHCPNINCNIGAPHAYNQEHVPPSPAHSQLLLT